MTQLSEVSAELEAFVRREAGVFDRKEIHASSVVEDDFGITGDDASELMIAYFERFPVKVGDYDFHRYFEMEGFSIWPLSIFTNWLHRRWGIKQYDTREPLTVGMLQRAIELGEWDSERLAESAPIRVAPV